MNIPNQDTRNKEQDVKEPKERRLPKWLYNLVSPEVETDWPCLIFNGSIEYCATVGDCASACEEILVQNDNFAEIIIGFDMEWPVIYQTGISSLSRTSLIQLCTNKDKCYLFHMVNIKSLPLAMIHLFHHPNTKLVGINIVSDLWKLNKDFNISVKELIDNKAVDLGQFANNVLQCNQTWSMERLVLHVMKMKINKADGVRKSSWNQPTLSNEQKLYAATDAFASFLLYHKLRSLMNRH